MAAQLAGPNPAYKSENILIGSHFSALLATQTSHTFKDLKTINSSLHTGLWGLASCRMDEQPRGTCPACRSLCHTV